jgi:signal transduction histidine kinase/CheY-like chemotaxis protein
MGLGILGARRLMDLFDIQSDAAGTRIALRKILPASAPLVTPKRSSEIAGELLKLTPENPFEEVRQQNQELMRAMDELRLRQEELMRLNQELQDTNRGVLALYAELDEKADHLRRADEMKSRFLSNMSHEFRTPLNSMMALARILLDKTDGDLTPEQAKQVGFIKQAAEALTELVNDLLDLAKVEAGKEEVHPAQFDVSELFGALRGMLRPLLVGDAVRLVFEEPAGVPPVFGDEGKVSQILRNFISNALKFTERGEIRVSARQLPDQQRVVFQVADTGIGIAPDDQKLIFGEYQQVQNPIQKRVKGTGLGLPLSRKLAELMQGRITLDSTPGAGSTFSLELPLAYEQAQVQLPLAPEPPLPRDPLRMPVLVVEDSEAQLEIYRSLLRNTEFQIVAASNVEGARQALRELAPKALILDIQLRGQDSWAFLASLKNGEGAALPVLVVSNVDDEQKARGLGADAYFAKPVERPWLLHTLRALTRSQRATILVVDDDELSRYTLQDALRSTSVNVVEAASGDEGLRRAREDQPLAILLDLNMPGMDGFEVLERLGAEGLTRHIPVIVATSKALTADERARLTGALGVVSKEALARGPGKEEIRRLLLQVGLDRPADAAVSGAR